MHASLNCLAHASMPPHGTEPCRRRLSQAVRQVSAQHQAQAAAAQAHQYDAQANQLMQQPAQQPVQQLPQQLLPQVLPASCTQPSQQAALHASHHAGIHAARAAAWLCEHTCIAGPTSSRHPPAELLRGPAHTAMCSCGPVQTMLLWLQLPSVPQQQASYGMAATAGMPPAGGPPPLLPLHHPGQGSQLGAHLAQQDPAQVRPASLLGCRAVQAQGWACSALGPCHETCWERLDSIFDSGTV